MDREYGVYTYSFEDALIFLEKELITYFCENNLKDLRISDRKDKLYRFYAKFKIYDLYKQVDLGKGYYDEDASFYSLEIKKINLSFGYPYSESAKTYILNSYKLIVKIAEWNGVPYNLRFSYPVLKVDKEYNHWKTQRRKCFHNRKYGNNRVLRISKSEKIAGTDPEYECYLSARQKDREATQNFSKPTHNGKRFQIPGGWKYYNRCRKQWAKNIENPSYKKLSKAVWEYELNDKNYISDGEYYF